jgi:hypothetical protein
MESENNLFERAVQTALHLSVAKLGHNLGQKYGAGPSAHIGDFGHSRQKSRGLAVLAAKKVADSQRRP